MKERSNGVLHYLNKTAGKTKLNILLLAIVQAVLGITGILYALMLKELINSAVDADKHGFIMSAAGFAGIMLLQQFLRAFGRWLDEYTRSSLENRFRGKLFSDILSKDFGTVSSIHSGEWMNRLTSDTTVAADGMASLLPNLTGMCVRMVGALSMIIIMVPLFSIAVILGGVVLFIMTYCFRRMNKALHKQVQERDGKVRSYMQDVLGSLIVVRSYAVENTAMAQAQELMDEHRDVRMKRNLISGLSNAGIRTAMNGGYVIGAIFCGYGILHGTMTYGTFTAILQLISQIRVPFTNLSGFLPQWYSMLASAERLMEAESLVDRSNGQAISIEEICRRYTGDFEAIGLRNAKFTYKPPVFGRDKSEKPSEPVFSGLDIEIKKGEYTAFVGHSGCGKSTVMKVMLSIYSLDSGEKYVRCGGHEEPLTAEWQKLFAYVPQGNHLMSGTIRSIISLPAASRSGDDNAIWNALKIACAEEFVSGLEKGIDTVLGERGQGLSEGQMQRIAIARAVFSDNPILILDESTSALDEQTERKLLDNLRNMTDKTVMIVTHRPAALEICDKVIEVGGTYETAE